MTSFSEKPLLSNDEQEDAVHSLLSLIRFPTISGTGPEGSYDDCAQWILKVLFT